MITLQSQKQGRLPWSKMDTKNDGSSECIL